MELTFESKTCDCLRPVACSVNQDEQTQELKLSDSMPDIGRVLCAWGQVLIRGKEWRGNGMGVSGGVMAWVLYAPEDGTDARVVETWLPFQLRWDFPEAERDGTIRVTPTLCSVDARSVSARKLMVRTCVSVLGEAYEPIKVEYATPAELPEDVRILENTYPVRLPKEAGEKAFLLDEPLVLPSTCAPVEKLLYYTLQPELIDQKVMADKVVFRGAAAVHILYRTEDASLKTWDFEVPFSQYSELEREYGPDACADIHCAVTSLELEADEQGGFRLKAGLAGQYLIYTTDNLHLAQDAYSPTRSVQVKGCELQLPAVLDTCRETLRGDMIMQFDDVQVVDVFCCMEQPSAEKGSAGLRFEIPRTYQLLYYDPEGKLQSCSEKDRAEWSMSCGEGVKCSPLALPTGKVQTVVGNGSVSIHSDVLLSAAAFAQQGIPVVTGLELGEMTQPDPGRPSLVLRRADGGGLWGLAKEYGSCVEEIRRANGLEGEPAEGRLLLIPIP